MEEELPATLPGRGFAVLREEILGFLGAGGGGVVEGWADEGGGGGGSGREGVCSGE